MICRNVNRFFLEIGLKSSIISKVDHPMSKNWKKGSIILLETTNKFWGPIVLGDQLSWGPFVHGDQIFGDCLSRGTNFLGDHLSMGTNCLGDHLSMGTKWAGTVSSWGPIVGDQMSGDWMGWGPNEKQPIGAHRQSHFWHPIYDTNPCWKYEKNPGSRFGSTS